MPRRFVFWKNVTKAGGLLVVLVLSASMSTLEAVVLTSASAVAVDLIPALRKKETKPEHQK